MSELWAGVSHLSSLPPEEDIKRMGESLLRDQFAIAALTALAAKNFQASDIADLAYEIADAMLKAREAK